MKGKFDSLKAKLEEEKWPEIFLFKFIVPSDNQKIALITGIFDNATANIELRPSKTGKYTSISVKETMKGAEEVIDIYEKADKIDGVIIL